MTDPALDQRARRICVCVIMNHPYPNNIPLIRKIYAGRFSHLYFLIPFVESEEEDIITIYRGSYDAAGFVADARRELLAVDADFYFFIHDDVLLNPSVNEGNFLEVFPLGRDEAFIPELAAPPADAGDWMWYFGFIARLFFPKSVLFGAGIEYPQLLKYLPPKALIQRRMDERGDDYVSTVQLETHSMRDVRSLPHRILLTGISASKAEGQLIDMAGPPGQEEIARLSQEACARLIEAMLTAVRVDGRHVGEGDRVPLPFPLTASSAYTDFYIVPGTWFRTFAHYCGVVAAANLWAEVMVPTLLVTLAEAVRTAGDFGMDFSGFDGLHPVEAFRDLRFMAIHPFKMSQMSEPERALLLEALDFMRRGLAWSSHLAKPGRHVFRPGLLADYAGVGWYHQESWGRWGEADPAEIVFDVVEGVPIEGVRLHLQAAVHPSRPIADGEVTLDDLPPTPVSVGVPIPELSVDLHKGPLKPGRHRIALRCLNRIRPIDIIPGSTDERRLGIGVKEIEFL